MRNSSLENEVVELKTESKESTLKLSDFELYGEGSFKCRVEVNSRGFGYKGIVFFDQSHSFLEDLERMSCDLEGEASLFENYHDHYLKFSINKFGHVFVDCHFIEYSEFEQFLTTKFKTDQTCLLPFIKDLMKILNKNS